MPRDGGKDPLGQRPPCRRRRGRLRRSAASVHARSALLEQLAGLRARDRRADRQPRRRIVRVERSARSRSPIGGHDLADRKPCAPHRQWRAQATSARLSAPNRLSSLSQPSTVPGTVTDMDAALRHRGYSPCAREEVWRSAPRVPIPMALRPYNLPVSRLVHDGEQVATDAIVHGRDQTHHALVAMAASTALPPVSRIRAPTCAASGCSRGHHALVRDDHRAGLRAILRRQRQR